MRFRPRGSRCVLSLVVLLLSSAGCLSLGTRTTYVQETPETLRRITALETRVAALEQTFGPTQSSPGVTPESIPAFRPSSH